MDSEVIEAMAEAAATHLAIDELQERAGALIAEVTGAEAGYVTAGAAAGLVLAGAACVARYDPRRMDLLPDTSGMPNEVIVQRLHRNAYDHALRTTGLRFVEVGYSGFPGAGRTHAWEIEASICDRTVAIAHPVQDAPGAVPLPAVVEIAHRYGVPIIVDAAAAVPPPENLRRFIAEGADLVVFSGGKGIGGPQASGILCGRRELIESAALQHQDMTVHPCTWRYRNWIQSSQLAGIPHHGIGRPMKVGKEAIVGLMVALRRFVGRDHDAERRRQHRILTQIYGAVRDLPDVEVELQPDFLKLTAHPVLVIDLGGQEQAKRACAVVERLEALDPPVYVGQHYLDYGQITIAATTLLESEVDLLTERLTAAISDL